ncbi:DUF3667 domain-containing protein [uncultured Maribacter sp.]|uniref:DUF3667 domain-containing protein n=1 Tax=uncultured Maribacter sp. TaxID=431308 RepID=UPI0026332DA7|nr:DUF3667 domain-containing protein [uncultured Maribacter sp.]
MDNKPTKTSSGRYQLKYRGVECRNCKHPLDISDKYCPNCSQANSIKKLSIKDFFDEFFASVISYDSKLLKTLAALLLRPGKITRDYIQGKRISYTNPFRFLLSLSLIYFFIISFSNDFSSLDRYGAKDKKEFINVFKNINFDDKGKLNQNPIDSSSNRSEINKILEQDKIKDSLLFKNPKKYFSSNNHHSFFSRFFHKIDFFTTTISKDTIYSFDDAITKYQIKNNRENKSAYNSAKGLSRLKNQPGSFLNSLISKLPFTTFFFLPIFAFFIWMIYIRKKYTYTDHIIFSFHNQSLLFILLIVSYLINNIFKIDSQGIFLFIFLIYLYKSMRNFYKQRRFITIIKYLFLNTIFVILATIAIIVVLTGSIFTF